MDNGKLNFRDIPVDKDLYEIKESSLARKSYRDINVRNPKLWEYGQQAKPGFTKYLEEVIPVDYHQDSDEYTDTLDFDKRGTDPSFTFDDIRNAQDEALTAKEEIGDLDVYEEVNHIVQDAFADYLDDHYDIIKDYLKNSKFDTNNLSMDFFNRICSSVASDILLDRNIAEHVEDLYEPGYFDDIFSQYISDAVSIEEKNNPKPLNTLEEATLKTTLSDAVGFVIVSKKRNSSSKTRGKLGKLEGPFLALKSKKGKRDNFIWVADIEDAEIFTNKEEAQQTVEEAFFSSKVCKVVEVFYSDLLEAPSTLKESRIGDVEILLDEFDKHYPKGNPKRDEYNLTHYLMKSLNLDKDCAYEIASQYLEKGYFTH